MVSVRTLAHVFLVTMVPIVKQTLMNALLIHVKIMEIVQMVSFHTLAHVFLVTMVRETNIHECSPVLCQNNGNCQFVHLLMCSRLQWHQL